MEIIISLVIGFIVGFVGFIFFNIGQDNRLIERLDYKKRENSELREDLSNAEIRVTGYARKIKKIEDILTYADKTKEPSVLTVDKIKKELFSDANQDK